MKITKEMLDKVIEKVKDYDQNTGIDSININLQPFNGKYRVMYLVRVFVGNTLYKFFFGSTKEDGEIEVTIEGGDRTLYSINSLQLSEEPYSLPNLLRTLIYSYVTSERAKLDELSNKFNSTVLYED